MTTMDWGRASLRELDPACVQPSNDFATFDPPVARKDQRKLSFAWQVALVARVKAEKESGKKSAGTPKKNIKAAVLAARAGRSANKILRANTSAPPRSSRP